MKLTNEEFINRAKSIHGDKYDYSNTQYINSRTKVIIIVQFMEDLFNAQTNI